MERGFVLWSDTWDLKDGHYTLSSVQRLIACNDPEALARIIRGLDPSVIPNGASLHVFREGIDPIYDHPANASGGHFKMQATSVQMAGDTWALLAGRLLAGQLPCSGSVNGVTYMRTLNTRGLKLWVANSLDKSAVRELRGFLHGLQNNQNDFVNLKFCPHKYILKAVHGNPKVPATPPKSDQRPRPPAPTDRAPAPAGPPPAPSPPSPPWLLPPVRHVAVCPDPSPATDGCAGVPPAHYALLNGAVPGSYAPATALLGLPSLLALIPPDSSTPLWVLGTQPPRQHQLAKADSLATLSLSAAPLLRFSPLGLGPLSEGH